MKGKSESVSVLSVQKQMKNKLQQTRMKSQKKFVPFLQERHLGKLIKQNPENNKEERVQINNINFKNFKQIYRKESRLQEARYHSMTRNSQQKDLLSERGWVKKKLIPINTEDKHQILRHCCSQTFQQQRKKENKFQKIDLQLYKKMEKVKPKGMNDPDISRLFEHYVKVSELNENIRRRQLVQKKQIL